jgi:hypothetical protein
VLALSPLLDIQQAAEFLNVKVRALYEMVRTPITMSLGFTSARITAPTTWGVGTLIETPNRWPPRTLRDAGTPLDD